MTLYGVLVTIHVVAAVVGLGAAFALPSIVKSATNVTQARYSLLLNKKVEKFAKVGSITLLATGIILGVLNTALFTTGWYLISIVIYIAVQPIVAGIMPKVFQSMEHSLEDYNADGLPEGYNKGLDKLKPLNGIMHSATVILIILMVLKPF